jgi:hypothetical protein
LGVWCVFFVVGGLVRDVVCVTSQASLAGQRDTFSVSYNVRVCQIAGLSLALTLFDNRCKPFSPLFRDEPFLRGFEPRINTNKQPPVKTGGIAVFGRCPPSFGGFHSGAKTPRKDKRN